MEHGNKHESSEGVTVGVTLKTVEVECLLKNGREVFLSLDLPVDELSEAEGVLTYRRHPEPGVTVETMIPRSEVAYLQQTTRDQGETPREPARTLPRSTVLPRSE